MDTDDSRPSTLENDSDSENSRSSTPIKEVTPHLNKAQSSSSSSSSDSSSSSSSSDSEDDVEKRTAGDSSSSSSSSSSSDYGETEEQNQQQEQEQSEQQNQSPESVERENSVVVPTAVSMADGELNISHDDLSDVSDMDSEKRDSSKRTANENDYEENTISNDFTLDSKIPADELTEDIKDKDKDKDKVNETVAAEDDGSINECEEDLRDKIDLKSKSEQKPVEEATNGIRCNVAETLEDLVKTHDDDALDFEAEDGECQDISREEVENPDDEDKAKAKCSHDDKEEGEEIERNASKTNDSSPKEDLEEGEVSDEDEKRPEETEPKPVCRFYTRGQCTWGMSCRFLHPGVTDKGNYTMFENMVRSLPMPQPGITPRATSGNYPNHGTDFHDYRSERPPLHHRSAIHHPPAIYGNHHETRGILPEVPVVVENAWERGLRTAKEMMRKANKRKEQDMDFEDKKMNLTLSPDELDKDPYFVKDRASSPSNYSVYSPPDRYGRGAPPYMPPYEDVDVYGRMARYRELPPHRMPQYEDDRRLRPTREVIVQRVETGRGDEWSDPWMRSKSPGARSGSYDREERRRRDRRSYSSNSSYSSSNSSQSDSSSDSSHSSSPTDHKRRYNSHKVQSTSSRRRTGNRAGRSPSQLARRSRRSPRSISPNYRRVAQDRKGTYSPASKRKKISSPIKKIDKSRRRRSSSSSDSDSSASSYSDSESGSSSSESSSGSKDRTPHKRTRATDKILNERSATAKKPDQPTKKRSPISIELKKPTTVGVSALVSPTHSTNSDKDNKKSRREELLKQLRAVEDAIAKKRSKLT